uniref:Platelet glycoprotein 4 n=1 Tax=Astyanax mexicanus TaxID=7994 RepID=A0A8B9RLI0_ASTMX
GLHTFSLLTENFYILCFQKTLSLLLNKSKSLVFQGVYSLIDHTVANMLIQLSKATLFQRRTVRELLWGYTDPMLKSTLGVFYPYNNTFDGPYSVFTGKDDITKVAYIDNWRGYPFIHRTLHCHCHCVCSRRSVYGEYEGSEDLKGITVYRYTLPDSTFASPTINPHNKCYCTNYEATKNCTMAGVLDIKTCTGSPVFISLPHFLHGSPDLLEVVDGLRPDDVEHKTFLDVEPTTGFTLRFAKRLQINMGYGPSKEIKILNQIKHNTLLPILWLNETAMLDDETADRLKTELFGRVAMLEVVQISLIVIGAVLCVLCLIGICVQHSNRRKIIA